MSAVIMRSSKHSQLPTPYPPLVYHLQMGALNISTSLVLFAILMLGAPVDLLATGSAFAFLRPLVFRIAHCCISQEPNASNAWIKLPFNTEEDMVILENLQMRLNVLTTPPLTSHFVGGTRQVTLSAQNVRIITPLIPKGSASN